MCHLRDDDFQDKKEPVAPVDIAQEAIDKVAGEIMAMGELALFKGWLKVRQDMARHYMNATSGEEFSGHCADFSLFADAAQVVFMFEREARG
jgi:hypothetical protein